MAKIKDTAESKQRILEEREYLKDFNIKDINAQAKGAFDDYMKSQEGKADNLFGDLELPNKAKMKDELLDEGFKKLQEVFNAKDKLKEEQRLFNGSVTSHADTLKNDDQYSPYKLVNEFLQAKGRAVNVIKRQQENEIKELTKLFEKEDGKENPFLEGLQKNHTNEDISKIKEATLKKAQEQHKKESDAFSKKVVAEAISLLHQLRVEENRLILIEMMAQKNKAFRTKISQAPSSVEVSMNNEFKTIGFKGVSPQEIDFNLIPGAKISETENGFTMSMPGRFFSDNYYARKNDKMDGDYRKLARAVMMTGKKGIVFDLSHHDPDSLMNMVRSARTAARQVGFEEKDIDIKIPGHDKPLTLDEIYSDSFFKNTNDKDKKGPHPVNEQAKQHDEQLISNYDRTSSAAKMQNNMRNTLNAERKSQNDKALQASNSGGKKPDASQDSGEKKPSTSRPAS